MQKGNYCNSVQISEGEIRADNKGFEINRELIEIAQGEDRAASEAASEELIKLNRGLVRSIALRFRERGMELDDLMQIGTIGLFKAIRSFDLERGTCFSTYAVPMIFGEIRRALRDEGPIKVGRYYKKLGIELMKAKNAIAEREGREAHIRELAEVVGVSVEEAAMALDAMSPITSLSDYIYGEEEGAVLEDTLADADSAEATERLLDRMALQRAISKMPSDWQ
ncbi:MAG: sigma-70 family RNA polymerase sigma factor, partial [Clostridia bacterium]|nr:sigma-70 family RNA polymerase sigma factor [Clostridia bacterium]